MGSKQSAGSSKEAEITEDSASISHPEPLVVEEGATAAVATAKKAPWWSYVWDYEPGRTKEERAFVQKLDVYLLTLMSFGYFIKNLDQTNIANAFVSGMKEDLAMNGNEINLVDTAWTVGYVVGQIPSQVVLTKVRPSIWVPSCELVWTVLTFCLAAATRSGHVIAIRFFVGLAESIFYPAAHTILGSWYKPSELGKRACIFHASSAAATMFSGYLQAGVYTGLNGVGGMAGWKWLFVSNMTGSAMLSYGLGKRVWKVEKTCADRVMARERMRIAGRAPRQGLGRSALKRIFGRWHIYLLTILYIIFINSGSSSSVSPLSLWLKSQGYPVAQVNIIPTGAAAIQLVLTVVFAMVSDLIRHRARIMSISTLLGLFAAVCLAVWNIPLGLKWVAMMLTQRASVPYGPLSMSWTNEICGADAEERAVVIGVMNSMGYAFNAWVPLLTYPQVDAPTFRRGFVFTACAFVAQFAITGTVAWFHKRDLDRARRDREGKDEEGAVGARAEGAGTGTGTGAETLIVD
ncbi:hypothetical protein SLS62_002909 [Diatrype stigma]|uniref:Major facilitator superfamily transporter n=1 Tax=Diatrype stigma TaxID=117547 RepID=A0AAN9UTA0_9PEZI